MTVRTVEIQILPASPPLGGLRTGMRSADRHPPASSRRLSAPAVYRSCRPALGRCTRVRRELRRDIAALAAERLPTLNQAERAALVAEIERTRTSIEQWILIRWEESPGDLWKPTPVLQAPSFGPPTVGGMGAQRAHHSEICAVPAQRLDTERELLAAGTSPSWTVVTGSVDERASRQPG